MTLTRKLRLAIELAARVLHRVREKRISLDLAFKEVVPPKLRIIDAGTIYRICRGIALKYYTLREIEKRIYGTNAGFRRLVRLWLYIYASPDNVPKLWNDIERFRRSFERSCPKPIPSIEELVKDLDPVSRIAIELSYPRWFVEELLKVLDERSCVELLKALEEEIVWVRVNTLKKSIEEVENVMKSEGYEVERDREIPYMLFIKRFTKPVHHTKLLEDLSVFFQDKASVLVVHALEPSPNDIVLDMTGAPGVKASLIMQIAGCRTYVVLCDVSRDRIARARNLLLKALPSTHSIDLLLTDSTKIFARGITKVLLDAPCSGSGTIGRDPAVKIHLEDREWVLQLASLQRKLLENALQLRRPVIYAVCSVLPLEGEEIVKPFEKYLAPLDIPGSEGYEPYPWRSLVRRFFPHIHRTHGFFVAKLVPR